MSTPELSHPSVKDYVKDMRDSETATIKWGAYDCYPDYQRDHVQTDEWSAKLISHFIYFRSIQPVYYHTVKSPIFYFQSLDGKQRSRALYQLVNNNLVFKNTNETTHPDPIVQTMLTEIHGLKFKDWPLAHQMRFLHMKISVLTYDYTMTPVQCRMFFSNLQFTQVAKPGETINCMRDMLIVRKITDLVASLKANDLFKSNRMKATQLFTSVAYTVFFKPDNKLLRSRKTIEEWVKHTGDVVPDIKWDAFVKAVTRTFMICNRFPSIKSRSTRIVFEAIFFLDWTTPPSVRVKFLNNLIHNVPITWPAHEA